MGMNLVPSDLLEGERLVRSTGANFIIELSEFGLSRFAADDLMWTVGMRNKEALGGKLHLTSYRLLFKTHGLNRITGEISLPLTQIRSVKDSSRLFMRKFRVHTRATRCEFVAWGIPKLLLDIDEARASFDREPQAKVQDLLRSRYLEGHNELQVAPGWEAANKFAKVAFGASDATTTITSPMKALQWLIFDEATEPAKRAWNDYMNNS